MRYFTTLLLLLVSGCADNPTLPDVAAAYEDGPPLVTADGKTDALGRELAAYAELRADQTLDVDFEVLFAPDDPVSTVELEAIGRVIEARGEDERSFDEGSNPYRIRYAVYNLRNPLIVEALADAEDAGVDVQVLIDAAQLDPERTWNTADERLIERGFEFAPDHRALSGDATVTADLIGIAGSGLMHLKARIFETPSERVVLSGSMNPGDNSVLNEETLHLIRDPRIVSRYIAAYDAVLHDEDPTNEWDDDAAVNVLFTPAASERAVGRVFDWLVEEDEQILLMMFSLRNLTAPGHAQDLVQLLGDKVRDGVDVWVITDRKQSDGVDAAGNRIAWDDDTEDKLRAVGVPVYEATNRATEFTAMHHKVAILGRTNIRVITDAANWTLSGLGSKTRKARNIESQLFIDSAALDQNRTGRRYLAQWMRVASRYAAQGASDGEPDYVQIWETLSARPGWPTLGTTFTAHEAFTAFGESVVVRGDLDDLGHWGTRGDGVQLATDGEIYPTWRSIEPTVLPLGQSFEWKFTVGFPSDSSVRWESGDNRAGFVQPTALTSSDAAHHVGDFR